MCWDQLGPDNNSVSECDRLPLQCGLFDASLSSTILPWAAFANVRLITGIEIQ